MADLSGKIDLQEQIERLSRLEGRGLKDEPALAQAPGTMPPAWAIKIVSNVEYNMYNVRQVIIAAPGVLPITIGSSDTQAVNLAESFLSTGSVPEGTYAVMWRAGDTNVFYIKPEV
ncbi:hypothetical protein ACFL02_07465 [Planctomycetota bacterium]